MALLLDVAVKVSLLMLVTGVAIPLMRRASAASRHIALTAALGAAVLLPAARFALPAVPLFVLPPETQPSPAPAPVAICPDASQVALVSGSASPSVVALEQPKPDAPVVEPAASALQWSWTAVLGLVWLTGTAAIFANLAIAIVGIKRLAKEAVPVEDRRMTERLTDVQTQFGVRRPVALLVSRREWMPITWGLIRPTILLPASSSSWLDEHPARLDAVLVHEMAHIARRDAIAQRITRVAVAFFWFNPLVWLAARRARLERERACDDAVLARGVRASDYANDLIELAQTLAVPCRAGASALAMARRSQLEQRVSALLDNGISRRGTSGLGRIFAVAVALLMLPVAAAQLAARQLPAAAPDISDVTVHKLIDIPPLTPVEQPHLAERRPTAAVPSMAAPSETPHTNQPPVSEAVPQSLQPPNQPAKWRLERDAMYRLLIERARAFVKDVHTKVEIGTAAQIDVKPLEEALDRIERAAAAAATGNCVTPNPFADLGGGTCVDGAWASPANAAAVRTAPLTLPTDDQIANVRARFTTAMRSLDVAAVRWNNGLLTNAEICDALRAALQVLTEGVIAAEVMFTAADGAHAPTLAPLRHVFNPAPADRTSADGLYDLLTGRVSSLTADRTQNVPFRAIARTGTNNLSDDQIITLLKDLAGLNDNKARASALLDIASRYAFTPEMVTLYVAAAKGITSPAEQARVFAQPIRVK